MDYFQWRDMNGSLLFPENIAGIVVVLVYAVGMGWMLWRHLREFKEFTPWIWGLFLFGVLFLFPANSIDFFSESFATPLPTSPSAVLAGAGIFPSSPDLPLVAYLVVGAIAIWLGTGPAIVAGIFSGFFLSVYVPLPLADIFLPAFFGGALGVFVRQPFRGWVFKIARQPVLAVPLALCFTMMALWFSRMGDALPPGGLQMVDYAFTVLKSQIVLWGVGAICLAVVFQGLFFIPRVRPALRADAAPAYNRSLRDRFMIVIIPLVLLSIVLSVFAASNQAIRSAQDQSLNEMRRNTDNARQGINHFFVTGSNLLKTFVEDSALLDPDSKVRARAMENDLQMVPFFQQMLFVDMQKQVVNSVPEGMGYLELTAEEQNMVDQAFSLEISNYTHLTELTPGTGEAYLTFVQPVFSPGDGSVVGVLLGRTLLNIQPDIQRARDALQISQGVGFIMDDRRIISHPDPAMLLRHWEGNTSETKEFIDNNLLGSPEAKKDHFYEDLDSNGERVLTYISRVEGTTYYFVVLQLPYATVLESATAIAGPMLVVQLLIGFVLLLVLPVLSSRVTQPLNTLALAAHRIAQGNLGIPVAISGEDEVAQLGRAFEQMRVGLRARLDDLSLLLRISQAVSATLDLDQGVPPILQGVLEETGAAVTHFVLLGSGDRIQRTFSVGAEDSEFAAIDRTFATALPRRRDPLVIQDLQKGNAAFPATRLRSLAALPVRTKDRAVAVLWVGSDQVNAFDEARVNFLSTLSSQAAVLVENVRLFQSAEGGRRRLAAILSSTSDAILVTDQEGRLLLINPAVQRVLGLDEAAYGRPIEELNLPPSLCDALNRSETEPGPPSVEVPLSGKRTFYASVAPIMTAEGQTMGRVVVMRDITHFKELDEMKSDFVATVSHDLRAPLTFMRGYATMLTMVGDMNDKQKEYVEHIMEGIEQMGALIGDLLNLSRVEAGVGIKREPCRLGLVLVEAVDTMRARASAKGIALGLDPAEGAPVIVGDRTLLRQAIGNLVDNAIKYTPNGGQVRVGLGVNGPEAVVHVTDTGLGIAPEDQVRLFEKFYRVKRRETSDIPGTGLGLALVKSIVEHHQGRVWVESQLNKGTTFYVALPLAPEEEK